MRCTYGPDQPYTELASRALRLWRSNERKWNRTFVHPTGVLWMADGNDDTWENGSLRLLKDAKVPYERLSKRQLQRRWPQINFDRIEWGVFEPQSGYLLARASCQGVVDSFIQEGGSYRQGVALRGDPGRGVTKAIQLADGSEIKADHYVFACGPWMPALFPETMGDKIQSTKQDVFFFGTPPGDSRFHPPHMPVWADHRIPFMYGIPGNDGRGFKIADDTRGPAFDPTNGNREISNERLQQARAYMEFRFPGMQGAPLVETRVCQYEQTPDSHFIIDRHPDSERIWLVGGGSGHGFKHGPAVGEFVAKLVLKDGDTKPFWRLSRFLK